MSGQPFTVVGVMPAGFNFINPDVRLWLPAAFTPEEKLRRSPELTQLYSPKVTQAL
jgi:hypothetical protein